MSTLKTGEHSKGESKAVRKESLQIVCSSVTMGALYRPQKVKGRPSDMTPDKTAQSLETITIIPYLCQGMGLMITFYINIIKHYF